MKNRPELVAAVLFILLTLLAAAQHVFIVPAVVYMLAGLNVAVSLPGRVAISLAQYGSIGFLVGAGFLLLATRRKPSANDPVRTVRTLNLATIVVVLFMALQATIYVDLAKSASKVMRAGGTSTASNMR